MTLSPNIVKSQILLRQLTEAHQNTVSVSYALKFINPYKKPPDGIDPETEGVVLPILLTMQDHPNILTYFGKFHVYFGGDASWLVICTEVCAGSLQSFLQPIFTQLTQAERMAGCWEIVRQILSGWRRCRENWPILMHRDIKLSNGNTFSFVFSD